MKKQETRFLTGTIGIEKRSDDKESRTISGYAAVFDKVSADLGWFKETINRSAFDGVDMSNVLATFNHDFSLPMARTDSGTLDLSIDKRGLKFSFDAPNTTSGNDLLENVRNGNVKGSSFMFTVEEDVWTYTKGEIDEREITQIGDLIELGPVTSPAYPDSTAETKHLELRKVEFLKKEEEGKKPKRTIEDLDLQRQYEMLK